MRGCWWATEAPVKERGCWWATEAPVKERGCWWATEAPVGRAVAATVAGGQLKEQAKRVGTFRAKKRGNHSMKTSKRPLASLQNSIKKAAN